MEEFHLAAFEGREQPVDDAAAIVGMAIEREAAPAHEAHRLRLLYRRWASITRNEDMQQALTGSVPRSGYQSSRTGTDSTHWRTGGDGKA